MVERAAEGVDVGAVVDLLAAHLLGGDVVGRAPDLAGVALHRGEAEIDELRVAVRVEEHVLGLHVAVDEPLLGGERKRVSHLLAHLHHAHGVHRAGVRLHLLVEGTAAHELHRDVRHAVLLSEGVDLRDVRVVEARRRLGLALEALHERRVVAEGLQHHLDGDLAVQHLVARQVDAAHAAVAQLPLQDEVSEIGRRGNHLFFVFFAHELAPLFKT